MSSEGALVVMILLTLSANILNLTLLPMLLLVLLHVPGILRPLDPPSTSADSDLCWYHYKHGDQAQHCRTPCTWDQGN